MTTFVNNRSPVHKGDGLQFIAMVPDVCKTPSPGGPVPLPYPNIAMSSDLADGTTSVEIEGNPAAIKTSKLSMSTGDEAGTAGGGLISSKVKGALKWMLSSLDVKFEDQGVVRFMDDTMHNGNAGNTSSKTLGKASIPAPADDIFCDNCGAAVSDPSHHRLAQDSQSRNAALEAKGHTTASLVVDGSETLTAFAGNQLASLTVDSFGSLAQNFQHGTPIRAGRQPGETFAPGNCAEQKVLYEAFKRKLLRPGGTNARMSVAQEQKGKKQHVAACKTCQRVLTSMLCTNKPKEQR